LVVIEQEKREFVEPILRRLIRVGAKVWTDGGLAYKWLADEFVHLVVVHSNREFSRVDDDTGDLVSTHGVDSLFMRLKRHHRLSGLFNIAHGSDGDWLGEFLWRERFLSQRAVGLHASWREEAFWSLCDVLAARYHPRMVTALGGDPQPLPVKHAELFASMEADYRPASSIRIEVPVAEAPVAAATPSVFRQRLSGPCRAVIDLDDDSGDATPPFVSPDNLPAVRPCPLPRGRKRRLASPRRAVPVPALQLSRGRTRGR